MGSVGCSVVWRVVWVEYGVESVGKCGGAGVWGVRLGSWGVGLGWSRVLCKYCVKSVGAGVWCVGVGRGECVQWGLGGVG